MNNFFLCLCVSCMMGRSASQNTIFVPNSHTIQIPLTHIHPEGYLPFEVMSEPGATIVLQGGKTGSNDICFKYSITDGNTRVIQYEYNDFANLGEDMVYDAGALFEVLSVVQFWASWEANVIKIGLGNTYGQQTLGSLVHYPARPFCNPGSFWIYSSGNFDAPSEITVPTETLPIPTGTTDRQESELTDGNNDTCVNVGESSARVWGMDTVQELVDKNPITVTSYGKSDMSCGKHGIQFAINSDQRDSPWLGDSVYLRLCTCVHQEVVNGTSVCRFTCACVTTGANTCKFLYILTKKPRSSISVCEVSIE